MSYRSPIKDARGLGSAHHGVDHWWAQRTTALALIPLLIWFVVGIALHGGADYAAARAWVSSPVTAVLMVLTLGAVFYHGALGIQVVIEDYVDGEGLKLALIILVRSAAIVLALAGIFAVLSIAFGG
jgi:succinate dehydrogenase / fumarate reductase membrane anchor subunit